MSTELTRHTANDAIRWFAEKVAAASAKLPRDFADRSAWEAWRNQMKRELVCRIGLPTLEPATDPVVRSDSELGESARIERVDVPGDGDYSIPAFVIRPRDCATPAPALLICPGWPQTKYEAQFQRLAIRMAEHGFVSAILDHAPFGETSHGAMPGAMTQVMGMGHLLGISQLAFRAAEAIRVGEYLRSRDDVDSGRVGITGLCQGGMTTWMAGALDERFAVVAPVASATTFVAWSVEMSRYRALGDTSPYPFGMIEVCDVDHLHACVAPRPLLVQANAPDDWWPLSGYHAIETLSRRVYALYNADERCEFAVEAHEHAITGPFAERLERFLVERLASR